jgi:hypothetical protein
MMTCGHHGETIKQSDGIRATVGCWCYIPLAAKLPDKECWLVEMNLKKNWINDADSR